MPSYTQYMRQISVLDSNDEDITWITVKGNHIPIKNGQNKGEAIKEFFESKKTTSQKNTSQGTKSATKSVSHTPAPTKNSDGGSITNPERFAKWFRNSKIKNEKGEPYPVYHGSLWEFDTFRNRNGDINFSFSEEFAHDYASRKSFEQQLDLSPVVKAYYIRAENPFDFRDTKQVDKLLDLIGDKEIKLYGSRKTKEEFRELLRGEYGVNELRANEYTGESFKDVKVGDRIDLTNMRVGGPMSQNEVVYKTDDYVVAVEDMGHYDMFGYERLDTELAYKNLRNSTHLFDFAGDSATVEVDTVSYNRYANTGDTPAKAKFYLKKAYNPTKAKKRYDADNWFFIEAGEIDGVNFEQFLIENGYDSVYKQENGTLNISVFNNNQVKSVNNNGDWSSKKSTVDGGDFYA